MLIGLITGLVFFLWSILLLIIGYKLSIRFNKGKPIPIEEKEKIRRQLMQEGINNIMNYDYNKALERK